MAEQTGEGGCRREGVEFRYPSETPTSLRRDWRSSVAIAAAHQRKTRFAPGGWSGCADREFSRPARGYAWRQIELRRSRGKYCRPLAHRVREGPAPIVGAVRRQGVEWRTWRPAVERAPQPSGGMRPYLEIIVQRQLDGVGRGNVSGGSFSQSRCSTPRNRSSACQPSGARRISAPERAFRSRLKDLPGEDGSAWLRGTTVGRASGAQKTVCSWKDPSGSAAKAEAPSPPEIGSSRRNRGRRSHRCSR